MSTSEQVKFKKCKKQVMLFTFYSLIHNKLAYTYWKMKTKRDSTFKMNFNLKFPSQDKYEKL